MGVIITDSMCTSETPCYRKDWCLRGTGSACCTTAWFLYSGHPFAPSSQEVVLRGPSHHALFQNVFLKTEKHNRRTILTEVFCLTWDGLEVPEVGGQVRNLLQRWKVSVNEVREPCQPLAKLMRYSLFGATPRAHGEGWGIASQLLTWSQRGRKREVRARKTQNCFLVFDLKVLFNV